VALELVHLVVLEAEDSIYPQAPLPIAPAQLPMAVVEAVETTGVYMDVMVLREEGAEQSVFKAIDSVQHRWRGSKAN